MKKWEKPVVLNLSIEATKNCNRALIGIFTCVNSACGATYTGEEVTMNVGQYGLNCPKCGSDLKSCGCPSS